MLGSALLGSFYLASATAQTPGAPPPLPIAALAAVYARADIARSNATRSNYIRPHIAVLMTKYRYPEPVEQVDLTAWTRMGTLHVTQAINDEPDSCSLTLTPELPAAHVPQVGDVVSVGIATEGYGAVPWDGQTIRIAGGLEFAGPVVVKTHDRRNENKSPWIAVQCQDWQWFFDAQLVNESWPAQSATTTILDLLARFVNYSVVTGALAQPFTADYVVPNLPVCDAFIAINWRPSEVLRHLTNALKGGFYIDPRRAVHAWADGPEANISDPQALTNYLWSLLSFRHTVDASQVRRKVVVEGMRARTLTDTPAIGATVYQNGIPVDAARPFDNPAGVVGRMGTQLFDLDIVHPLQAAVENPFTAHVIGGNFAIGGEVPAGMNTWLTVDSYPGFLGGIGNGWIKVGEQFVYYASAHYNADYCPKPENRLLLLNNPGVPFGQTIAPIKTGETITWLDWIDFWQAGSHTPGVTNDPLKATLAGTDVLIAGIAVDPDAGQPWAANIPVIEALVTDGRYSYAGALARAAADVNFFRTPLLRAEWQTFDWNARPGRNQFINLTGTDPVTAQLTIQTVNVTFDLRTLHPRRACAAGLVKPSTLLDILTTENA